MDGKKSLRIIWIAEAAMLFVMSFFVLLVWPARTTQLIEMMPYLFGLIAMQGAGAIGGSNFKRLTEGYKLRAENKKGGR